MQRPYTSAVMTLPKGDYYGSLPGPQKATPSMSRRILTTTIGFTLSLVVPSVMFAIIYGVLCFALHYKHPSLCYFIIAIGAMLVVTSGGVAAVAVRRMRRGDTSVQATTHVFVFTSLFLAFVLGVIFGSINYSVNMSPYYDMSNLNFYPGVDVSKVMGQQVMDAGRIVFTRGSRLNVTLSMGFKNGDTYCVSPITSSSEPLATYDFWAVGKNCCNGNQADFKCTGYDNTRTHAGLRLLSSDANYKLAVEQAEIAHHIRSDHPLFFKWTEDPVEEVSAMQATGFKYYLLGVLTYFAVQIFAVIVASVAVPKFMLPA